MRTPSVALCFTVEVTDDDAAAGVFLYGKSACRPAAMDRRNGSSVLVR
jgi:hypothetical protein